MAAKKKTVTTKKPAPETVPSTSRARTPDKGEVRIRMYRQGLGDCFLLTFEKDRHILIDCGLLAGTPGGSDKIREVAQHVSDSTRPDPSKPGHLNALVVTHEHWDHVSGFSDARSIFEELVIDETWVAWTEDPSQDTVVARRAANEKRQIALASAITRLGLSTDPDDVERAGQISQTLNFLGGMDPSGVLGAFSPKTGDAMSWATNEKRNPKYLSPDDVVTREWLPGVTLRVLGPPKDQKALKQMDGTIGTDMYGMAMNSHELGFAAALGVPLDQSSQEWLPFDQSMQWTSESDWLENFHEKFQTQYRKERWRRVDTEWLNAANDLALQLDNAVNNTSLVLAFEFGTAGDVLLFVGDAQVGNWLSWAAKSEDLLKRTIFYKVGHHGSHNATLKDHGLESMTNKNLVAAIPVNEVFAKAKKPIPWMMPADKLYAALQQNTRGRILRADQDFPNSAARPDGLSDNEWRQFTGSVEVNPLFIDFFCKPRQV